MNKMKLEEFNEKFLDGEVGDDFIETRGSISNLDCDVCKSHLKQTNEFIRNGKSFLRKMECLFCPFTGYRRTIFADFQATIADEEADTK